MSSPRFKRGYRPLGVGEKVCAGDLIWFASRWQRVEDFKNDIGSVIGSFSYRHCRKLAKDGAS